MRRLVILGASGHGKVVADAAECAGWEVAFFDDRRPLGPFCRGWSVLGDTGDLLSRVGDFDGVVVGIGNNAIRLEKSRALLQRGAPLVTIVHPGAIVSRYAELGAGSVVGAGAVINADASLGVACIVNTGATVDHDCVLADAVHVSPGANLAGGVSIGECSWVGIGGCVRELVVVGRNVVIGAGASVVSDVEDNLVVVGSPAKALRAN